MLVDQITDHKQLTFARYRHRTHWPAATGRLIHLGDSWHAASPQLGQGANMALLDAYALARAVEAHSQPADIAAMYVRQRAAHVRLFQLMTWAFTPVYQSDSNILPWLRDWLAAPVSKLWLLSIKSTLSSMLSSLEAGTFSLLLLSFESPGKFIFLATDIEFGVGTTSSGFS